MILEITIIIVYSIALILIFMYALAQLNLLFNYLSAQKKDTNCQKFDFKSEFFSFIQPPAQALEKEVSCDFSSLTWVVENKTNYFE